MAPLTVAELERRLPFDHTDLMMDQESWNAELSDLLDQETARIEDWLQAPLTVESTTEIVDGTGGSDLPLSNRPVRDASRIATADAEISVADVLAEETGLVLRPSADLDAWPEEPIEVEYSYGYPETDVPGPLVDALVRLVRSAIDQIESDGIAQEGTASTQITYRPPAKIQLEVRAAVRQARPPRAGKHAEVV